MDKFEEKLTIHERFWSFLRHFGPFWAVQMSDEESANLRRVDLSRRTRGRVEKRMAKVDIAARV